MSDMGSAFLDSFVKLCGLSSVPSSTTASHQSSSGLVFQARRVLCPRRRPGNAPKGSQQECGRTSEPEQSEALSSFPEAAGRRARPWRCHSLRKQPPCDSTLDKPSRSHFSALLKDRSYIPG